MTPCPCCSSPRPLNLPIIGIQYGIDESPALILWNCPCGTTRAIKWASATLPERQQAHLAEMALRPRSEEMMG